MLHRRNPWPFAYAPLTSSTFLRSISRRGDRVISVVGYGLTVLDLESGESLELPDGHTEKITSLAISDGIIRESRTFSCQYSNRHNSLPVSGA